MRSRRFVEGKWVAVPGNLRVEFGDAMARGVEFGAEFFDGQPHHAAFATNHDAKTLAAMPLDDIEECLVQTAFSQQVHRQSGCEWEFVFHCSTIKSPTTF